MNRFFTSGVKMYFGSIVVKIVATEFWSVLVYIMNHAQQHVPNRLFGSGFNIVKLCAKAGIRKGFGFLRNDKPDQELDDLGQVIVQNDLGSNKYFDEVRKLGDRC